MKRGNKKQNTKNKRLKRMVCLFFLLALAAAGYLIYRCYREDKEQEERFEQLEKIEEEWEIAPVSLLDPATEKNPDWIGWIKIPDSSISYPVMQRKGDSEFYLHRDFDGNYSFYGTPFLDVRCTPDSDNCIIYGHNINGGRMFGALHAYAEESYYREHPVIRFRAGEEQWEYQIISVMQTTVASPAYSFTDTGNWEEYGEYVKTILSASLYRTEMGESVETDREQETAEKFFRKYQFLTLSTCRSWIGRDARLLVVAARKR